MGCDGGSSRDRRVRSPSLPSKVRLALQRATRPWSRMAMYRVVESLAVMVAGMMTRECVRRISI
jgi:hypothetical protein